MQTMPTTSTPPPSAPASRTPRGLLLAIGAVVLVGGLLGAAALWIAGEARYDDNLATFARAPSGCSTTLDFERSGDFTLYLETTGRLTDLDGDCPAAAEYDRNDVPEVDLALVTGEGTPLEIEPVADLDYDNGTYVGSAIGVVRISEPGEHVLTVPPSGDAFAVTVGGSPDEGVALLRWGAVALAVASLAVGGLLLVTALRRPPPPAAEPSGFEAPGWPMGPPGFPAPPPTTGAAGPPVAAPAPAPAPPRWQPPSWGPPSVSSGA
jgi:hypothetical protein